VKEIIWQEPPSNARGYKKRHSALDTLELELRKNPNRWALVAENSKQSSANPRFKGKEFERAYRIIGEGASRQYRLYIRYIEE